MKMLIVILIVSKMIMPKILLKIAGVAIFAIAVFCVSELLDSVFSPKPKCWVKESSPLYQPFSNLWRSNIVTNQFIAIEKQIINEVQIGSNRDIVKEYVLDNFIEPDLSIRESKTIPFVDYYFITASTKNPLPYQRAVFVKFAFEKNSLTGVALSCNGIVPE